MYIIVLKEEAGSNVFVFPANPEQLEISCDVGLENYELLEQGEIVLPGYARLRRIRLSAVFQADDLPLFSSRVLRMFCEEKKVLRLIVTGTPIGATQNSFAQSSGSGINLPVVMEALTVRERGGEIGTLFCDMVLREYRPFALRTEV